MKMLGASLLLGFSTIGLMQYGYWGQPIPGFGQMVAGKDSNGNAQPLSMDTSGDANVNIVNTPAVTITGTPTVTLAAATDPCKDPNTIPTSVVINIGAGSTGQIVSLTNGQTIFPCGYDVTQGAAGTFKFVTGTNANCASGQTDVSGTFDTIAGSELVFGPGSTIMTIPISQPVCGVTTGLTAPVHGIFVYIKK